MKQLTWVASKNLKPKGRPLAGTTREDFLLESNHLANGQMFPWGESRSFYCGSGESWD